MGINYGGGGGGGGRGATKICDPGVIPCQSSIQPNKMENTTSPSSNVFQFGLGLFRLKSRDFKFERNPMYGFVSYATPLLCDFDTSAKGPIQKQPSR